MENDNAETQLRELERAEAAPYLEYRVSKWWAPGFALWFGFLVAALDYVWATRGEGGPARSIVVVGIMIILAVTLGMGIRWYQHYNGTWPAFFGNKPPEITRAYARYSIGVAILVPVIIAVAYFAPWWASGLVTFGLVFVQLHRYSRFYDAAAAAAKARLG